MNMRILSLSSLLLIAGFINSSEAFNRETFYKEKLNKANKDYSQAHKTVRGEWAELNKTKKGKVAEQRLQEYLDCKKSNFDCSEINNALNIAHQELEKTAEYKNNILPLYQKEAYHWAMIVRLRATLDGGFDPNFPECLPVSLRETDILVCEAHLHAMRDFQSLVQEAEALEWQHMTYSQRLSKTCNKRFKFFSPRS